MSTGRSLIPVLAAWVAWVYLLSLLVLLPFDRGRRADLRPEVAFVEAERPYVCDPAAGANALLGVEAELSDTFDHPVMIPVSVVPASTLPDRVAQARQGVDVSADRDAMLVFPANSRRGRLRERESLADVTVVPDASSRVGKRFRLKLDGTDEVVVATDAAGLRIVDIPAGSDTPVTGIPVDFERRSTRIAEREMSMHPVMLTADRPAEADAELRFSLHRRRGDGEVPVVRFSGTFPAGTRSHTVRLGDLITPDDLRRIGMEDDDRPGYDQWYELHLDARPPLMSKTEPCFTTLFATDDDEQATLSMRLENAGGDRLERLMPGEKFWVAAELSRPIEVDYPVRPALDGRPLEPGGTIAAGERGIRLGPYTLPADVSIEKDDMVVTLMPHVWHGGACPHCSGTTPGGCDRCRKRCIDCGGGSPDCPSCRGSCIDCGGVPGGCQTCRKPCEHCGGSPQGCARCRTCPACGGPPGSCDACSRPVCGVCGDRPGGCAACGFGSGRCIACDGRSGTCKACDGRGTCRQCDGKGGDCKACGGSGKCGTCDGKGGPCGVCGGGAGAGGGSGGGSGSPVSTPPPGSVPVGPSKPGDFMIFLVNDQRLYEPRDVITDRVVEAIEDRKPYNQGVIVINAAGAETILRGTGDRPSPETAFEPFTKSSQDLEGQIARVVQTIIRKRRNAEKPGIRALVVWPERELVSAETLEVFAALADDGRGPVSFLCPDADPERARELDAAIAAAGGAGQVTVRSPKSEELVEHIDDVLDAIGAAPGDRLNRDKEKK